MLTLEEDVSLFSLLQPGSAPCLHHGVVAVTTDRTSQWERGESAELGLEILEKRYKTKHTEEETRRMFLRCLVLHVRSYLQCKIIFQVL